VIRLLPPLILDATHAQLITEKIGILLLSTFAQNNKLITMNVRHFLRLSDLRRDELDYILHRTTILKEKHRQNVCYQPLQGKSLGMIFEKSSTRTRVSFEAGMAQLGGHAIFLSSRDTQLGRGEPLEDVARVLSRMVDLIMIRTDAHEKLERFARFSLVPVINGLSDIAHPCQLLADLYTFTEYRGNVTGKKLPGLVIAIICAGRGWKRLLYSSSNLPSRVRKVTHPITNNWLLLLLMSGYIVIHWLLLKGASCCNRCLG